MFNPSDRRSLDRLARAVDFSRYRLQPFREQRLAALRHFVGAHYGYSGSPQRVPLNLLQLAVNIYLRQLVARAPRAMVSTRDPQLKPVAADMQAWMDRASDGMRLGESLRVCVLNALFSIGIMKVGEAHVGDIDILGTTQHVGQPFAEPVDLDDWVHDITAKRFDQVQFCGNRYRVSLEEAQDNPLFDKQARQQLSAQTRFAYNERGDTRTQTLSQSTMQLYDELQEHVELWDLWLPREKLVLVMPYQDSIDGGFAGVKPLHVIEWRGPTDGPFLTLSYCDVPNNVMPAAPVQAWQDLHELVNTLWRKLARQGERQKTILGVMGSATDDAERINRTSDGEATRVDFPDRCKELSFGGIRPENLAATIQAKDLFVYMAGNLDSLGGLSPQAQTLGQDELLNKNSAAQVAEMQDRTIAFTHDCYKRLAWHWWTNPLLTYEAVRQAAGMDIPVSITPQMRQVPYEKLDFQIDPYSMQHSTPQTRLAATMQVLQQVIMPALPMMKEQGVSLKWPALLEMISKFGNLPELGDILAVGPPPDQQGPMQIAQQAASDQPPAPAVTTRNTVRTNRPGMTREGQSQVMQQLLAGSTLQSGQRAAVGRPTG
jgi:hypothetical protein